MSTQDRAPTDATWHQRDDLPDEVRTMLERPVGEMLAIVATVDADGMPRTAAFGVMRATSPSRLRFGCRRTHRTFANLQRDGRVMVALYAEPDIAVGIAGQASIVAEHLQAMPDNALIEVEVTSVKNDLLPEVPLTSGITYAPPPGFRAKVDAVAVELTSVDRPGETR